MKNVRNLEACEQGGEGQEEASGGVCRGGRLGEAGRSAVEGRCRTAGGQRTNSPRISTAAGVGVCCGSCARGLRLCEQRERDRQFMRRSTRERRVVLIRIYLAKQCVYIYGKGCNKTTIASAAAVSICSPGGGEKQHAQPTRVSEGGGGCLRDEVVRREQSERVEGQV